MRIKLLCVGKTKEDYLKQAVAEYLHRIRRYGLIEYQEIKAEPHGRQAHEQGVQQRESDKLRKMCTSQEFVVALDEHGKQLSSVELAEFISRCQLRGDIKILTFVTGGVTGFSRSFLQEAQMVLSLSRMTFPHQFCRLLLLEQLYRAYTILAGESYHKE